MKVIYSILKVIEWNIEQVANYIAKLSDNYFASFADVFRHHVSKLHLFN